MSEIIKLVFLSKIQFRLSFVFKILLVNIE